MKVPDEVATILTGAWVDGNAVRLPDWLDRDLYVKVDKVLKAAGGKWNRQAHAHLFPENAQPIITALIHNGDVESDSDRQFFPTPPAIAAQLIDMADVEPWMTALEPSAGKGGIAALLAPQVRELHCIEKHAPYAQVIKDAGYARVAVADFLALAPDPVYDRVVMNPPFTSGQDIAHVTHALQFLAPGGLLATIMPLSVMHGSTRKQRDFRHLVGRAGGDFERLPEDAFKVSGTGVHTVIAVIPKPVQQWSAAA